MLSFQRSRMPSVLCYPRSLARNSSDSSPLNRAVRGEPSKVPGSPAPLDVAPLRWQNTYSFVPSPSLRLQIQCVPRSLARSDSLPHRLKRFQINGCHVEWLCVRPRQTTPVSSLVARLGCGHFCTSNLDLPRQMFVLRLRRVEILMFPGRRSLPHPAPFPPS